MEAKAKQKRRRRAAPKIPDGNFVDEPKHDGPSSEQRDGFVKLASAFDCVRYRTAHGQAHLGDTLDLIKTVPDGSVDLVVSSPPYALLTKKAYGNASADDYLEWFKPFAVEFRRVLKDSGSLVLEFGGTWLRGKPVRSLYHFEILLYLVKHLGFNLAQEFYWFNPAKMPSPAEWVTVRRCRLKDAVNTVWWLSKTDNPKANNKRVLYPYGEAMERLFKYGYNSGPRPSEYKVGEETWAKRNEGAIAPNILVCPNTGNADDYLVRCRRQKIKAHPARFPPALPRFFIRFLTEPGDVVLDPFAGSNVTGIEAEQNQRYWLAFEQDPLYFRGSSLRFFETPQYAGKLGEIPARDAGMAQRVIVTLSQPDVKRRTGT